MKQEKLMDAIGQVDDRLVEEAEQVKHLNRKQPLKLPRWEHWGSLVAILVLVLGIWAGGTGLRSWSQSRSSGSSSGSMAETAVGEAADGAESGDTESANQDIAESAEDETESDIEAAEEVTALWTKLPTITVWKTELTLTSGNYEWTVEEDDGEGETTTVACGAAAYQQKDTIPTLENWDEDGLSVDFDETGFTGLTAVAYSADSWDNEKAEAIDLETDGTIVALPDSDSDWIVAITITWDGEGYSGTAEYDLFVTR